MRKWFVTHFHFITKNKAQKVVRARLFRKYQILFRSNVSVNVVSMTLNEGKGDDLSTCKGFDSSQTPEQNRPITD